MSALRILIVEDEPAIADSIAFSLGREGYAPVCVQSGTEGLARVEAGGLALVILDVGLPDLSGFEVCRRIRYRDSALPLTRFEYLLLRWFLQHPGQVFSREQLLDAVWGVDRDSVDRTVDTHVKTLRAKLRVCDPEADPIVTHRGLGYSLQP